METSMKRFIAGWLITIFASIMNACSPVVYVPERPRPVVHVVTPPPPPPAPVVVVQHVIPVWAPPYMYVTEVHYYYFPDYMVYYDVFGRDYVYYNGYSWINVTVLPSMPVFMGFDPFSSYIVVLNRSINRPWYRHEYYHQQYPVGYYNNVYAPRQSLGSNTVLRAYDENQSKPLFVDKRTNKEVAIKYDVISRPRTSVNTVPGRNNTISSEQTPRSNSDIQNITKPRSDNSVRGNSVAVTPRNVGGNNPRGSINSSLSEKKNTIADVPRENKVNSIPRNQVNNNLNTDKQTGKTVSEIPRNKSGESIQGKSVPDKKIEQPRIISSERSEKNSIRVNRRGL